MRYYYGLIFWRKFKRKHTRGSWIWNRGHHHIWWLPWDSSKFINKFLSNVTNKTNLNKYLASKFLACHESKKSILCLTFGDSIIRNGESVLSKTHINQCSSEKIDPKTFRHVINLGKKGYTNLQLKTIDSYVVIFWFTYADVAMSDGIESFLVVFDPKDKII